MFDYSFFVIYFLIVFIMIFFIIQSIAFITLFERHLLSLSQNRLGPNKVSFMGVLQAIFDGVKLLLKEQLLLKFISNLLFLFIPCLSFLVMMFYWFLLPYFFNFFSFEFSFLLFFCFIGVFVYFILLSGLVSKSKYGIIGSIRSSSQSVSYEISFTFIFLSFVLHSCSFYFCSMMFFDLVYLLFPLFISILCELNRAPFDLSEGESELVSGFNTEYSSVSFVLLFLSEYGIIIFFSSLLSLLMFSFSIFFIFIFYLLIILVRSCYPRIRYDFVMNFFWTIFLPISMIMFFFYFGLVV